MKKRLTKLVALALALVMLTGCGLPGFDFGGGTDADLSGTLGETLSQISWLSFSSSVETRPSIQMI